MGSMTKTLAIAIPTWGRPAEIGARLREVVPQLCGDVGLWVFENGRTEPVAAQMEEWPAAKYCPSEENRGVYRNVMRCFEEVDAEWVWILGDDDSVHPDAVSRLLAICRESDAAAVVFRSFSPSVGDRVEVSSLEELARTVSLSEALFLTGTVWRREVLRKETQSFMESVYTMSAQLVVLCRTVAAGRESVLVVGDSLVTPKTSGHRWSRLEYTQRSPALLDHLTTSADRQTAARWLAPNWWWAAGDSVLEVDSVQTQGLWRESIWRGLGIMKANGVRNLRMAAGNWLMGLGRCLVGMPAGEHFLFAASLPPSIGLRVLKGLRYVLGKRGIARLLAI
jgi:glycosyltransferase involved in cell wall biosynthesis